MNTATDLTMLTNNIMKGLINSDLPFSLLKSNANEITEKIEKTINGMSQWLSIQADSDVNLVAENNELIVTVYPVKNNRVVTVTDDITKHAYSELLENESYSSRM